MLEGWLKRGSNHGVKALLGIGSCTTILASFEKETPGRKAFHFRHRIFPRQAPDYLQYGRSLAFTGRWEWLDTGLRERHIFEYPIEVTKGFHHECDSTLSVQSCVWTGRVSISTTGVMCRGLRRRQSIHDSEGWRSTNFHRLRRNERRYRDR